MLTHLNISFSVEKLSKDKGETLGTLRRINEGSGEPTGTGAGSGSATLVAYL